jgi:TonB-linked SusC/RagA family outer membrane protein
MRKMFLLLCVVVFCAVQAWAQRTLTGKVTDEKGIPIPNASVFVKGTSTGTITKPDGTFSLTIPANAQTLVISSVDMVTNEVTIGSQTSISVNLLTMEKNLQEVVVTALGVTRDKRSLGYATQTIKGEALAEKGQVNLLNALQGKVAGVNIVGASGSAGASTNINIRGISSFTGNNQPLIVVDGIPISNNVDRTNGGPLGTLGDNQPSNRALDLDINNIESVNVLKGSAAAALYGSRASSGAIIITTKKGGSAKGRAEVILSSSFSLQTVTGLPEVQNEYGQGLGGVYNPVSTSSWGPRFGSTPTIANGLIVGGIIQNYNPYPSNIRDFFETGSIADNNLTINGGDLKQNYTFSIGNLAQQGILPNTSLGRTSVKFGANTVLREKLKIGGSVTLINTLQKGILGGNGQSSLGVLAGLARSIDLTSYKVNKTYKNPDGSNNFVIPNTENPYFGAYENPLRSNVYRIIGTSTIGYDFTKWLTASYRLGIDFYTDRRKQIFARGSGRVPTGQVLENMFFRSELNGDLMLSANKRDIFFKDFNATILVGQNVNQRAFQNILLQGDNLAFPGFYNISNATTLTVGSGEATTKRRLLGYYAQLSLSYANWAFLEMTGRADQSSTLPKENNTYFYPSISAGIVFTDALKLNSKFLNYGKIRASAAKVGNDADPYLLLNTYGSQAFGNNVASFSFPLGATAGFGASSRIAPIDPLKPEFTTSYEIGINLGFFRNRVSIDAAYFNQVGESQIINVAVAPSTGYATKTTNIGKMTNKGVELLINATIVNGRNFSWDFSGNYTRIRNKVVDIAPGIESFAIPGNAFTGSIPSIKIGHAYGVILGGVIPKNAAGERLINPATGLYQPLVANQVLSNPNPDYQLGFTNTLRFKALTLGSTFDFTKGGQILSFSSALYKSRGVIKETAVDRELPRVLPGVIETSPGKYIPNNIQISAQTYWQTLGGLQSEFNVYDATVFRLRELSLSYDIPKELVAKLRMSGARFSLFANNVFYVAPNAIIDPEVNTQGQGNIRGLELQSAPSARTVGANLRLIF